MNITLNKRLYFQQIIESSQDNMYYIRRRYLKVLQIEG